MTAELHPRPSRLAPLLVLGVGLLVLLSLAAFMLGRSTDLAWAILPAILLLAATLGLARWGGALLPLLTVLLLWRVWRFELWEALLIAAPSLVFAMASAARLSVRLARGGLSRRSRAESPAEAYVWEVERPAPAPTAPVVTEAEPDARPELPAARPWRRIALALGVVVGGLLVGALAAWLASQISPRPEELIINTKSPPRATRSAAPVS